MFFIADVTRSLASFTDKSGSPTISIPDKPGNRVDSTLIKYPSIPFKPIVFTVEKIFYSSFYFTCKKLVIIF